MIMPSEIKKLFYYFEDGYITSDWTFNFQNGTVSLPLSQIEYEHDIPKLLLAFCSTEICFGKPYINPIRNYFHRTELKNKVNQYLGTRLKKSDFEIIANNCSDGYQMNIVQDFVLTGFNRNFLHQIEDCAFA
ncbi:hypothetical protein [Streptococcus suis]|uniref:hypothetical protein n=1 Tax=Streptococcus suis TaxID=1307 RepID=UPI000CF45F58|nr:hypothetical protein [Streptococcus suis]